MICLSPCNLPTACTFFVCHRAIVFRRPADRKGPTTTNRLRSIRWAPGASLGAVEGFCKVETIAEIGVPYF
jgi:hypothetical protein